MFTIERRCRESHPQSNSDAETRGGAREGSELRGGGASWGNDTALQELQRKAAALEKKLNKSKRKRKKGGSAPSKPAPPPKRSGKPQDVLARKAKRVCETIGIQGLAQRYKVAATAEAVATAYSASYPPTLRTAVHDGCKSAFPGQ